jgi:hypothetical protein
MAAEKGYIQSASFFRTHPPYFERIVSTLSEIEYLPASSDLAVDSSAFHRLKRALADSLREEGTRDPDAPTLRRGPACEDEPAPRSSQADRHGTQHNP